MLPVAAFDPAEIVDWVVRHAGPIFIAVVFFVLPILRGLKEQAQKKAAAERQRQAAERRVLESEPEESSKEPADGEAGRRAFEALLRGEEPAPASPPTPVAPPPLERVPAERAATLAGPLSDFAPVPTEDDIEGSLDEERSAVEGGERALREERQRRADFLAREREQAARKTVAPEGLATLEAAEIAPRGPVAGGARRLLGGQATDRRALLRRAIVAREILGPPLSVRTDTEALGPTALNR